MKNSRIQGQRALITGASSGIGKACAEAFAQEGVHLVLTARRLERLQALAEKLKADYGVQVDSYALDVQSNQQVQSLSATLDEQGLEVDILVNNAGLALSSDKIQDGQPSNWDTMIDTNVKGLLYVTHALLPGMLKRNRGHIINIGSVAGHRCYVTGNVYCATKYAVRAISQSLRLDVMGSALRVSEVDPGAVETEFSEVRWKDKDKAQKFYQEFQPLIPEDIADAVLYCATRPPHVNVAELQVFPQAQASITDIYRPGQAIHTPFDQKKS